MAHNPTESPRKIIKLAKAEVGYREGFSNGHWNNRQKYSPAVPGLEWSNFQAWCATFVSWLALKAGFAALYPRTASCDVAGQWFKARGRWSEYPAIGAQAFYGTPYDLNHTGLVYDFDGTYIYVVEGNTNLSGSREGSGVYLKKRRRRDLNVVGYGYPEFPEGIVSADPAFTGKRAKPEEKKAATIARLKPANHRNPKSYKLGAKNTATQWLKGRLNVHGYTRGLNTKDATYGAGTRAQVAAFQRAQGWRGRDADGYPGPETIRRLADAPRRTR